MWYFAWVLGIGFAVLLAILNALWGENEEAREEARDQAHADAMRHARLADPARPNGSGAH
jgi:cyd operon protein YbgT